MTRFSMGILVGGILCAFLYLAFPSRTQRDCFALRDSLSVAQAQRDMTKPWPVDSCFTVIRDTVIVRQVVVYSPQDSTLRVLKEWKR